MLCARLVIGLIVLGTSCANAQAPYALLGLTPPVEVKKCVWAGDNTRGALEDSAGRLCYFEFEAQQLVNVGYLAGAQGDYQRCGVDDSRGDAIVKLLQSWVDGRFSAGQQVALLAEPQRAHLSAYRGRTSKVVVTDADRAQMLANTPSPCGIPAVGDSIDVQVEWTQNDVDKAWHILTKFGQSPGNH